MTGRVKCKYCSAEIAKNGTRMAKHIADCKNCDEQIKIKYLGNKDSKLAKELSLVERSASDDDDDVVVFQKQISLQSFFQTCSN